MGLFNQIMSGKDKDNSKPFNSSDIIMNNITRRGGYRDNSDNTNSNKINVAGFGKYYRNTFDPDNTSKNNNASNSNNGFIVCSGIGNCYL